MAASGVSGAGAGPSPGGATNGRGAQMGSIARGIAAADGGKPADDTAGFLSAGGSPGRQKSLITEVISRRSRALLFAPPGLLLQDFRLRPQLG